MALNGLTFDYKGYGDWRPPNIGKLESLVQINIIPVDAIDTTSQGNSSLVRVVHSGQSGSGFDLLEPPGVSAELAPSMAAGGAVTATPARAGNAPSAVAGKLRQRPLRPPCCAS